MCRPSDSDVPFVIVAQPCRSQGNHFAASVSASSAFNPSQSTACDQLEVVGIGSAIQRVMVKQGRTVSSVYCLHIGAYQRSSCH